MHIVSGMSLASGRALFTQSSLKRITFQILLYLHFSLQTHDIHVHVRSYTEYGLFTCVIHGYEVYIKYIFLRVFIELWTFVLSYLWCVAYLSQVHIHTHDKLSDITFNMI